MRTKAIKWARYVSVCPSICGGLCLTFSVLLLYGHGAASKPVSVSEILDRVQKRYAAADFEADFVQETYLKAMDTVDTAQGHLYFGRSGMMRWHYKTPEEYFIISDGDSVWIYRPEENQVMVGRAVDYLGSKKGADFFTRPGELSKEFILELAPKALQERDHYALRLVPKTELPNLVELYLFISKDTFDIIKSVTYNAFGDRTTLRFHSYRFDQRLSSSLFVFEIPNGVEVVQLQGEQDRYEQ
ncbi:MAG: outer membrane lipoprotein carrier protein LolA [Deltaproteobacteria bacterium]|nr:outer membrane lipoprotein carrier protein LolA [Deltaproteobacteria bacterium]MBW2019292.1 outer membrane lipoprotein carrier protein LolA [Deltaproteobacteria bacterium]MBW2074087.1 outer membrane lipoprotein carrier protein LolA [Deltaproteobacteria bacterium]RLB82584.1 MAG: outer membrane lipoprotein carrier protein LolA [Deltaproteobacteria bacterium]